MSLIQKMKVAVSSKELLKRALTRMGYEFVDGNQKIQARYSQEIDTELHIPATGKLGRPIGFRKNKEGSYEAEADWMEAGLRGEQFTGSLNETVSKIKVEDGFRMKSVQIGPWTQDKSGNYVMVGTQWV